VGGFGTVYKARHLENGQEVAIKYIDLTESLNKASSMEEIDRESKTLKMLEHKHIIKLYHAFVNDKKLVMIMELASGGELRDYVEAQQKLSEVESRRLIQ
jgi:serine/threonine protein kinase